MFASVVPRMVSGPEFTFNKSFLKYLYYVVIIFLSLSSSLCCEIIEGRYYISLSICHMYQEFV